jgi:succinate dehydrogenase / fumarate reductase iron-sulfur subunit
VKNSLQVGETFRLRVVRENPAAKSARSYQEFDIPYEMGMTVLSALLHAKENFDHSIAIRFSCRMASCGACGMMINGVPALACYTQISEIPGSAITVGPLDHYPLVRDLITNFSGFFDKHTSIAPFLVRKDLAEQSTATSEFAQSNEQLDEFLQFSYCIKCGLCNAACPTMANDAAFIGPQALGQAYRYIADSRDEGAIERLKAVDREHGIWRCHFAGSCSFVCPKGVDPALAIQRLRRLTASKSPLHRTQAKLMPALASK